MIPVMKRALIAATSVIALVCGMPQTTGADLLSGPILEGGQISYSPPFPMPHYISDGSVKYVSNSAVSVAFWVDMMVQPNTPNRKALLSETNAPSIDELKRLFVSQSGASFIGTNVVANIIKLDGREAVQLYKKDRGYFICFVWQKGTNMARTVVLKIAVFCANENDSRKLMDSVESAKFYPPQ